MGGGQNTLKSLQKNATQMFKKKGGGGNDFLNKLQILHFSFGRASIFWQWSTIQSTITQLYDHKLSNFPIINQPIIKEWRSTHQVW